MKRFVRKSLFIIGLSLLALGPVWAQTPPGTEITNVAHGTYDGGGGVVVDVPSDTVVTEVREGLIGITKTTDVEIAALGDTIHYHIQVRNQDETTLTNVTILDSLDHMLSYVRSNPPGRITDNVIEWQIPELPVHGVANFHLHCKIVEAVYQDSIRNTAYYETEDGYKGQSEAMATVWQPWPAVKIDKTVDRKSAFFSDSLTYGLRIENTGPMTLTQLVVNDTLPYGTRFLRSTQPVDTTEGVLRWTVQSLDPGQKSGLNYQVLITEEAGTDSIRNTAYLRCAEGAVDTADTALACLGHGGQLHIKKFSDDSLYTAGDTVRYKIAVGNPGVRSVRNVIVRDTLSNHLEYLDATHDPVAGADTVTWHLGKLEPGFSDTLELETVIRMPIDDQTVIDNVANVTCTEGLSDTSLWTITVASQPVLFITKTSQETASPGDTLMYTLICSNQGTAIAHESVLRDTLPEYLGYVDASGDHVYDPDAHVVEWQETHLVPGQCDTLWLSTRIKETVEPGTQIQNTAWLVDSHTSCVAVSSCETETEPENLSDSIYAYKKVDQKRAQAGDTLTYTIWYGTTEHNVNDTIYIVDYLPMEVRLLPDEIVPKSMLEMESYDPITNQLRMRRIGLTTTDRDSIQLRVLVLEDFGPGVREIENLAEVHVGQDTVCTMDDERSDAKTRLLKPFLEVKKTVNRKVTEVGDILTYTVTLTNKSLESWLSPVEVIDRMPEGFRYQTGTSRLESRAFEDPMINGSVMTWTITDTLQAGKTMQLKYRVIVGLSVKMGEHENRVTASGQCEFGDWIYSEEAKAAVLIRRGAFDDRGFIFGKVYADENENGMHDDEETTFGAIELIMEDGTRVITDDFGKYSIPNVDPGQHVIRLNERTLPKEVNLFNNSVDFLDDPKSRLVRLSPAGVAKANFAVKRINEL